MKKLSSLKMDVTLLVLLTAILLFFISSTPRTSLQGEKNNKLHGKAGAKTELLYSYHFSKQIQKKDRYVFSFRLGSRLLSDTIRLGDERLFLSVNTRSSDVFSGVLVVLYQDAFCIYTLPI